jgi:hypothetical protein
MALTVRPDDEVYQFDTVWLGPDEYTLPIQARYVAWGTWLACFLVATAVLVPIGGHGPGGVLGSLMWSLAVSVVAARAVMLIVDHERPLRSLPRLFSAEARAALAASRGGERSVVLKPRRVRVRDLPEKVLRRRERDRDAVQRRAERRARPGRSARRRHQAAGLEVAAPTSLPAERSGPAWSGAVAPYPDWDDPALADQQWVPAYDTPPDYGPAAYDGPAAYEPGPSAYAAPPAYDAPSAYGPGPAAYPAPPPYDAPAAYPAPPYAGPAFDNLPAYAGPPDYPDYAGAAGPHLSTPAGRPPAGPPDASGIDIDGQILLPARRVP